MGLRVKPNRMGLMASGAETIEEVEQNANTFNDQLSGIPWSAERTGAKRRT